MSEVQDTIARIKKSVKGIVIVNQDGNVVKNYYAEQAKREGDDIAKYIPLLAKKARSMIRDLDPTNDLTFLRIKTRNDEIMVAPDKDYMLIVVQGPKESKTKEEGD
jgi:dynein light chain roadblock-type